MNNLFIFGCSYSATYDEYLAIDVNLKKYYEFRNCNFPKTWSELLANELELNLVNTATWGSNNYDIFENFCKKIDDIKFDDIVIIGWTEVNRFRLYSEKFNILYPVNCWTKNDGDIFESVSQLSLDEIILNRSDCSLWNDEVRNWIKVINKLSKLIGFKLYYWSMTKDFPEICIINDLIVLGVEDITSETNGIVGNGHLGEIGHIVQCNYFKNIIKILD